MSEAAEQYYCAVCGHGPVTRSDRFCPNPRCRQPLARNRTRRPRGEAPLGEEPGVDGPTAATEARPGPVHATSRDGGMVLRFPWGVVAVADRLEIGRDPDFSPLAGDLEPYGNISREHAEFCAESGRLFVTDIGSMNGTFVNDERLGTDERRELAVDDVVRFAGRIEVRVEAEP